MNLPGDRTILNDLEKVFSEDHLKDTAGVYQMISEFADRFLTARSSTVSSTEYATPSTAWFGSGLKTYADGATLVLTIRKGLGFIYDTTNQTSDVGGVTGLNDLHRYKPVVLASDVTFTAPGNATGSTRIDIIEVKLPRLAKDAESRDVLDEVTETIAATSLNKTLTFAFDGQTGQVTSPTSSTQPLGYKVGVAAAGVPATTAGYVKLAEITVASGAVSLAQSTVLDRRVMLAPFGVLSVSMLVTSTPATATHTITDLRGPAGIDVSVADATSGATTLSYRITVKHGAAVASAAAFVSLNDGGASTHELVGRVGNLQQVTAGQFSFDVRARVLNETGPTFGTANITAPCYSYVRIEWSYS